MDRNDADEQAVAFEISLTPTEAWHVAQFLKRSCFHDYLGYSVDMEEAYAMMHACEHLRRQFALQGIAPR